jgi:phenylacetate-CoA ligase
MFASLGYRRAPVRVQEALLSARSALRAALRERREFEGLRAAAGRSQWWSAQELRAQYERRVRALLEHAARHVPYYRARAAGARLVDWPLLDKAAVRAAGRALLAERRRRPLLESATSGSSGSPLRLWQDLEAVNRENAFVWRQLEWAGLRRGARRAWLRGDMIVPAAQREPPYWRLSRAENMLMLSSYHLAESSAPAYLEALEAFDPVLVQAYPSSVGFLAAWMLASGRRYRGAALCGVVTSSETLGAAQRRDIAMAFACPVLDWYGQAERVAAIGTCEHGHYHLLSDYSHVELLPAGEGRCELVGTGFGNRAMPLIRYRTGDFVRPAPAGERCPCGRAFPLIESIAGRDDDPVRLPDGRSIGRLDHVFKGVPGILEAQIRQPRADRLEVLVVPARDFGEATHRALLAGLRERLGTALALDIRRVEAIPRGANGKFRGVVGLPGNGSAPCAASPAP